MHTMRPETLGALVTAARSAWSLDATSLAARADVDAGVLAEVESGRATASDLAAVAAALGGTLDDFLAYGPRMSLLAQGWLDKPSAPMLLVNGEQDTQQPISDLYLMMKHGDPKDAWVNPAGGHMGRSDQWPQRRILDEVVLPWIERALAAPARK